MQPKNKTIRSGLILFAIGGLVLLAERLTNWGVSKLIGKLVCGARYMQVAGQAGDGSCGFNMDMLVGMASFLLCVVGIIFLVIGLIILLVPHDQK